MAKPPKDLSRIERRALLAEARADSQWAKQVAEHWRLYLSEIVLVVEEASLEHERLQARAFLLEWEMSELEKPDPM